MIKLSVVTFLITTYAITIATANSDSKCSFESSTYLCKNVNENELVENLQKVQTSSLQCDNCNIERLPLQQLDAETRKKLTKLVINGAPKVLNLDVDTFNGCENLISLSFTNLTVQEMKPELLKPLNKLDELNFKNTILIVKNIECFKYIPQLRKFSLTQVNMRKIVGDWFKYTPNLKELDFSEDNIETLSDDAFKYVPKLEILNLQKNNIKSIQTNLLDNLTELISLDLSQNPTVNIDITHIIQTNKKMDLFLMHDLPCQTFENMVDSLNTMEFVTECVVSASPPAFEYKTTCLNLRAYSKQKPEEKLTIFKSNGKINSDQNFNGLPCLTPKKVSEVY